MNQGEDFAPDTLTAAIPCSSAKICIALASFRLGSTATTTERRMIIQLPTMIVRIIVKSWSTFDPQ